MMWVIDDDGSMMFRLQGSTSQFGPQQHQQQMAGPRVVQAILDDLEKNNIDVETIGTFSRSRRSGTSDAASDTVWKGKLLHLYQLADAREYFQRLARSYSGK